MTSQLSFDLPGRPALGRADFLVSPENLDALAALDAWPGWSPARLALTGPEGSGKTHLAHVWAAECGAAILDGVTLADRVPDSETRPLLVEDIPLLAGLPDRQRPAAEANLFHLFNMMAEHRRPLVLTGRASPAHWPIMLPDLASRLAAMPVVRLQPPGDSLLDAILIKLFAERQLQVAPDVVVFLRHRIGRSGRDAERVVAALDQAALEARRAITRPFAIDVLPRLGFG
jgi:chromosomal replication initiation ATPase DnaA